MLTVDEVKHIALLARVGLKDEEIPKYQKDLSAVLDFFEELKRLPTDDVEPIGHVTGITGKGRKDQTEDFGNHGKEAIKNNFPDSKEGFLKVRSVF